MIGELSLDGSVRPVNGVLSVVLMAKRMGMTKCIVPAMNAFEGAAVDDIEVYGVHTYRNSLASWMDVWLLSRHISTGILCLNDQKGRYHSWISVTFAGSTR